MEQFSRDMGYHPQGASDWLKEWNLAIATARVGGGMLGLEVGGLYKKKLWTGGDYTIYKVYVASILSWVGLIIT